MDNKLILKKMVPIYMASFLAWLHNIVYTPLGYVYNTYPNQNGLVMLIAVLPGVIAMIAGLVAGKMMNSIGRKNTVMYV